MYRETVLRVRFACHICVGKTSQLSLVQRLLVSHVILALEKTGD